MTPKPITILPKRSDGWWLKDPNNLEEWREVGPYATKDEADDDCKGLLRFWKRNPPDDR